MSADVLHHMHAIAAYASAPGATSNDSTDIALLLTIITILIGLGTFVLQYVTSRFHRRFLYGITLVAKMVNTSMARSNLHIKWRDTEVADPHILEINLVYKGGIDVTSSDFDKGRPLGLNVNVPIIDLLDTIVRPERAPVPHVKVVGTVLKIGPDLLRKRQAFTFVLLVDGSEGRLECENPVANVKEKEARRRTQELRVLYSKPQRIYPKVIVWGLVVFVAFYLITEPTSSGYIISSGFEGLRAAGNALAAFIHSLSL